MRLMKGFLLVAAVLALTASLRADTVEVICGRDNTLIEHAAGDLSGGLMPWLFAGQTAQIEGERIRRALLRFEFAGVIPPGSTVTAATLRLRMNKSVLAGTNPFTLHRVLADWGEGTSDGSGGVGGVSTEDSVTWIHRFYPDVLWSVTGGEFVAAASATTNVSGIGYYTWSGSGLIADVAFWVNNPSSNFGMLLKGNEAGSAPTAKRFASREAAIAGDRPKLTITFTPPPTGACCIQVTGCTVVSAVQCSAEGGLYQGDGTTCTPLPCPPDCPADIAPNGSVDIDDLLAVIGAWGPCAAPCAPDIVRNGAVDIDDLLAVIAAWGPCA